MGILILSVIASVGNSGVFPRQELTIILYYIHLICLNVFLDLEFADLVYPTKIEILETYNPGAVVRILALDSECR